jgi:MFS family permease
MVNITTLKEYYKYNIFSFFNGFGGTVWGGLTYYMAIPVAYLTYLNASSMQIGLITAIFWAGFALPQVWAAYISETQTIKKTFMAKVLILSSLSWLILGVYILLTKSANTGLSIWLFLLLFGWACTLTGMFMPANFSLLFKIIPTERLGHLLGIIFAVQFGAMFFVGPAIKKINTSFEAPLNYTVLFLLTFGITLFMTLILLSIKEPEGDKVERSTSFTSYLGKCLTIIKTDKTLSKFIIGKWLMSGHYIMMGFIMVFLIKERGFNPENAGWFSSLSGVGLFIAGFTITRIADKYGPKYMLLTSHIVAVIYTILVWTMSSLSPVFIYLAFIITGLAQNADNVGYSNMCLLCCPTIDKSTYVGVTNIGVNMLTIPLPIIVGRLMDIGVLTFNGTFTIVLAMMVIAIIYILAVIDNPKAYIEMKAASAAK